MHAETVIWGLGNELLGDDAAGILAARRLLKRAPKGWTIVECATVPENCLSTLPKEKNGHLIVIDAADMGLEAGQIRIAALDDVRDVNFSTHGLPLPMLLAPQADRAEISIIAIQPLDFTPGEHLAPVVEKAVSTVVKALVEGSWRDFPPLHQENLSPR
ncbi:MAG: hydrogenase 3 maturation endopeptidase HyCI [Thermovirgaceae bacterium]